jgi:hypothetical protein
MCLSFNSKKSSLIASYAFASPPLHLRSKTVPIIGQKWDLQGNYNGPARAYIFNVGSMKQRCEFIAKKNPIHPIWVNGIFMFCIEKDSYFNVTLIIVKLLAGTLIVIFFLASIVSFLGSTGWRSYVFSISGLP